MNRRRQLLQQLCVCAIVAVSLTTAVAGATPSSSSLRGPAPCVSATASGAVDRPPAELLPDRTRRDVGAGDDAPRALSAATSHEGRGMKKKKNTAMNIFLGGGIMTVFVMTFMYLNLITVTLGKAFLFTFITKFFVSMNWKSSNSNKKSSSKDVTVVLA